MRVGLWIIIGVLILSIPAVILVDELFPVDSSIVLMAEGEDCMGDAATGVIIAEDRKGYFVLTSNIIGDAGQEVFMFKSEHEKYIAVEEMELREYGVALYKIIGTPKKVTPIIINAADSDLNEKSLDFYGYRTEGYLNNLNVVVDEHLLGKDTVYVGNIKVKDGIKVIEHEGQHQLGMTGGALVDNSERLVAVNIQTDSSDKCNVKSLDIMQILPYLQANNIPVKTGLPKQIIVIIPIALFILLLIAVQLFLISNLSNYKITGVNGQFAQQSIDLNKNAGIVFGRDPEQCQLVFMENAENISRRHCEIYYDRKTKRFMLVDYSSAGTLINDKKMKKDKPYVLGNNLIFSLANNTHSFKVEKK